MRDVVLLILAVAVTTLGVMVYNQGNDIRSQQQTVTQLSASLNNRQPSAVDIFHLRSECAVLAQKILNDNSAVDPAVAQAVGVDQSVDSNYDPKANRCYVELSTLTTKPTIPSKSQVADFYLFDGQTGSVLAFAISQNGQKAGEVFGYHQADRNATTHDDAIEYINGLMNDD